MLSREPYTIWLDGLTEIQKEIIKYFEVEKNTYHAKALKNHKITYGIQIDSKRHAEIENILKELEKFGKFQELFGELSEESKKLIKR